MAVSRPLLAVVGATGTGKSEFSLDIAASLARSGATIEVVNADAMQLYRGMDIGTAKLSLEHRRGVPHHMLDVLDVTEDARVAGFQHRARAAIEAVWERGAVPMLVGGSGLYLSSVLYNFTFPGTDPAIRAELELELSESGPGLMHRRLRELDPEAAAAIGPHNGRRLVRALEVIAITGAPFGAGLPDEENLWTDATAIFGLQTSRQELVERLDRRVLGMWASGLLAEVESLLPLGLAESATAGRAIGYAQAIAQLRGEISESEAVELTQILTRKFARRQVSWFRRYRNVTWFDSSDPGRVQSAAASLTGLSLTDA